MSFQIDTRAKTITDRTGGGCFLVGGLPFVGLAAYLSYLLLSGAEVTVVGRPGQPSDAWAPLLVILGYLAFFTFRKQRVVDLKSRTVRKSVRLLIEQRSKDESFEEPVRVNLTREVRGSGTQQGRQTTYYPVRLDTDDGLVDVVDELDPVKARRYAEAVARLADLPLHDSSQGAEIVRQPYELDRSVVHSEPPSAGPIEAPAGTQITVEDRGFEAVIQVPLGGWMRPAGFIGIALLATSVILFGLLVWSPNFAPGDDMLARFQAHSYLIFAVPIALLVLKLIRIGLFGTRIAVDHNEMAARRLLGTTRIVASELEELRIVRTTLMARSDAVTFLFGHGLEFEELEYLRALILKHLRG